MLQNYIKTAVRSLLRHRKHALLNIMGLGIALAASIIVFLVIQFETSHDKHLVNYKHLYQIVSKDKDAAGEHFSGGVPFPTIKFLRQDFPQYAFAELMQNYGTQVAAKNTANHEAAKKFIEEDGVFYGEPVLLKMFEVKFLTGQASVLSDVNSVIISKSTAEKYFGDWQKAVGQRLNFNNATYDYAVGAVFEDVPENSDFPFKIVASYAGFVAHEGADWSINDWGSNTSNHQVYALLPEGTNTEALDRQLSVFEKKYNTNNKQPTRSQLLHPLANIHFDERFGSNGDHITSKASLYTLGFIGLLVLLMACINFINLSTALAATRSKEVGVRKVMGGSASQMRTQILIETATVVFIATVIALLLAWLALPYIKNIMVVQTSLRLFNAGSTLFIIGAALITILLSGVYPAVVMSRFNPIEAIKSKAIVAKVGGLSLRRALVVLQFAFSQIFIIATIVAVTQMNFIKNTDLGFIKESVLMLPGTSDSAAVAKQEAFKNDILEMTEVKNVSFSYDAPSSENSWQSNFAFDKMEDRDFDINLKFGDAAYFPTYGIQLVAGKFYEASDTSRSYVVNETLLKKVGIVNPEEAIGKLLRVGGGRAKPVVGVVKDFKLQSLREEVPPLVIMPNKKRYGVAGIKLASTNLEKSKEAISAIWNKHYPEYVYNPQFFDESIDAFYEQEERLSLMYKVYALLAIFISCLGLYGLISFMAVQKTKEVGIRKVLGASVKNIVYLFSKEFTILIAIAFLLAAPAAWYMMHTWLQDFVYRIDIGVGVFLVALVISLFIAWVTVGYKAVKSALSNPVKNLRTE
ncbi:MAG: FtsX-like permease family protein [Flaviaesturariibacter sp.]|nr:FtsX-like permease family protein [Flaviaesturariibacter sp.]